MRTLLKIVLGIVVVLVVVVAGAVAFAQFGSERKLNRTIALDVKPVSIPTDEAALARGKYLFLSRGCAGCHGADGAGKVVIDSGGFYVKSPDITAGPGGVVSNFTDLDWVKVIRHGVKPDGRPLMVMPSEDYARFTDADLGAVVAYVRALPAKSGDGATFRIPLIVRFMYAAGFVKDSAEKIDHTLPPAQPAASGDVVAHGAYVANSCKGCHNEALSGGKIPGGPPDWPPAANLHPRPRQRARPLRHGRCAGGDVQERQTSRRNRRQHGHAVRIAQGDERRRHPGGLRVPEDAAAEEAGREGLSRLGRRLLDHDRRLQAGELGELAEAALDAGAAERREVGRQNQRQRLAARLDPRAADHVGHGAGDQIGDAQRRAERAGALHQPRRGELADVRRQRLVDQALVPVEIGEREIGAAGMVDADEGGVGDQVEALLAAIFRMRPPADVGEQAGGVAEPRLLRASRRARWRRTPSPTTAPARATWRGERERR